MLKQLPIEVAIRSNPANELERIDWSSEIDYLNLGICYEYSRQPKFAFDAYKKILDVSLQAIKDGGTYCMPPECYRQFLSRCYENLARCSAALSDLHAAKKYFEKAIEVSTMNTAVIPRTHLALVCLQLGDNESAQGAARDALTDYEKSASGRTTNEQDIAASIARKIAQSGQATADSIFKNVAPAQAAPECYCSARENYPPHFANRALGR